jgi:large subunit ribosomal protein L5e
MGFVKIVKNTAYFKRFQVKFKRRRQCKTDYYARQRLITQDKNKYKTPKYRFVVRITNKDIICQIFSSDLTHDVCLASAYSHELKRYGITLGLTNYAAAYATGLLLARRVNKKFGLEYQGQTDVDGEDYNVTPEGEKKPFKALLDVGLARTTTGARIFGALKGACDGGIDIPHKDRRFPGSKRNEQKEWEAAPDTHRKYIFGGHVADYMKSLKESDEEHYAKQFKRYIDLGIGAADVEKVYTNAHKAIRDDPNKKRDPLERGYFHKRDKPKDDAKKESKKRHRPGKMSIEQRKARIRQKLNAKGVRSLKAGGTSKVAEPKKGEEKKEKPAPKAAAKTDAKKEAGKKDEAKKAEAKKAEGKKEESKKSGAKAEAGKKEEGAKKEKPKKG